MPYFGYARVKQINGLNLEISVLRIVILPIGLKILKVQSFILCSISLNLGFKLRETKNGTYTN